MMKMVSNYFFSWGTDRTEEEEPEPEPKPTQEPVTLIRCYFRDVKALNNSKFVQGSILLFLYEFVHSNNFFEDFIFYDSTKQEKSFGI